MTPWAPPSQMTPMPQMNFTGFTPPPLFPQMAGPMSGQMPGQNACSGHCYNCEGFGHMQRDCPMPNQGRGRRGGDLLEEQEIQEKGEGEEIDLVVMNALYVVQSFVQA